jgi:uncharacterized protein YbjT (DUF2867 family)
LFSRRACAAFSSFGRRINTAAELVCIRHENTITNWDKQGAASQPLERQPLVKVSIKEQAMKIAITTPAGHIGSKVTESLIDFGADLVLLPHDASKVQRWASRGVRIYPGSQDDAAFLTEATRGVDALFWVTPPNLRTENVREFQRSCGRAAAQATRINRIRRVVNISSIGAQLGAGVGLVNGLYDVERYLDEASENVTHLRPGYFFENFLYQLDSIRSQGKFFLTVTGVRRLPMIATRDIARVAADRLLDVTWSGRSVRGLHGPTGLSMNEAADEISRGLGHPVLYIKVAEEALRPELLKMGMSEDVAEMFFEMYRAFELGTLKPAEPRTSATTTPTTLEEFAREVMAPMIAEPVGAGL